jgi:2-polyprenyl-3-methyl-5-hydroxy-6-metoxy-1,4-benzoquinol methylase
VGNDTDSAWERYGSADPYYGVVSHPRFREASKPGPEREEFFQSGESYISSVLAIAHALFPAFAPRRAVDYGCGVGRLVIPLARRVSQVVGVDISESMLAEARRNCSEAGLANVDFALADDGLSRLQGEFDFIHSYIVFQHVPVKRGLRIFRGLLDRLTDGGVGIVQFTYANANKSARRGTYLLRKWVPGAHSLLEILRGRPPGPHMQLNSYPLDKLMAMLQESGCHEVSVRFSNHGEHYGALLFFRRVQLPLY